MSIAYVEQSHDQAAASRTGGAGRSGSLPRVITKAEGKRGSGTGRLRVALVIRAQTGDPGAFTALAEPLWPRLHRAACSIMGDPVLAEDATQQAMLDVWHNLPRLRDPARFEAWCFRTLTNACRNEWRRRKRWSRDSSGGPLADHPAPDVLGPVADREQLERGFAKLSEEHRRVILLHHYADMTHEQLAEVLDIPAGTVRSRLHRAMKGLRAALEADERLVGSLP